MGVWGGMEERSSRHAKLKCQGKIGKGVEWMSGMSVSCHSLHGVEGSSFTPLSPGGGQNWRHTMNASEEVGQKRENRGRDKGILRV